MFDAAIALSAVIGFVLWESLGLLTGGLVSAGYLSRFFEQPLRLLSTLALAAAVCLLVRAISFRAILYGRRRFMLTLLLSLAAGWAVDSLLPQAGFLSGDWRVIGHVVPGLIANDMYRQGIGRTLLGVLLSAGLVRLVLLAAGAP